MENGKKAPAMRAAFLAALLLSLFSIAVFSVQYIYSTGVDVSVSKSYGIFQNGVYLDTKEVLVPSPYAVKRTSLMVENSANYTRNITITVEYDGEIAGSEPEAHVLSSFVRWTSEIRPYSSKEFAVFGKDLETAVPFVSVSDFSSLSQPVSNKELLLSSNVSDSGAPQAATSTAGGYVRPPESALAPILEEPKKLNLLSKSIIMIFAGLVLLMVASGFGFVFGSEEERPWAAAPQAKIRITQPEQG